MINYVILDCEWDSAYFVPAKRFVNQLLQIGAVKLDENFNIIDTLDITIRSSFSKKVSKRFTELTGITKEMMLSGVPLKEAVSSFNAFLGDKSITMTWSDSDLYTIVENEKLLLKDVRFKFDKYLDLQKFIQNEFRLMGFDLTSQISLGKAAELLGVKTDEYELHTAKDDSIVSSKLLKQCFNAERFAALIKDAKAPEFYERLNFKAYYIDDFNSKYIPRGAFDFNCELCGKPLVIQGKWRFRNRNFFADFFCKDCNQKFVGRVCARKTFDDVKIKTKLVMKKPKEENENDMQPLPEKM